MANQRTEQDKPLVENVPPCDSDKIVHVNFRIPRSLGEEDLDLDLGSGISMMLADEKTSKASQSSKVEGASVTLCKHNCKNKDTCKHRCCKTGLQGKRRKAAKNPPITPPNSANKKATVTRPNENESKGQLETFEQRARDAKFAADWLQHFKWSRESCRSSDMTSEPTSEIRIPISIGAPSKTQAFINFVKVFEGTK